MRCTTYFLLARDVVLLSGMSTHILFSIKVDMMITLVLDDTNPSRLRNRSHSPKGNPRACVESIFSVYLIVGIAMG